jgi:Right handed beta helix region
MRRSPTEAKPSALDERPATCSYSTLTEGFAMNMLLAASAAIVSLLLIVPSLAQTTLSPGAGGQWGGQPDPSAIVVDTDGNDSNPCIVSSPCASLEKAREQVRLSSTKIVYLRAGTYNRSRSLTLDSSDSGETWMTYPEDAVGSAVIDGLNYTDSLIYIQGGSNITINGLTIQHFRAYGVRGNNTSGLKIVNCNVGYNTVTSWQSAGIDVEGTSPYTTIANNYVHEVGSQGIALFDNWSGNPDPGTIEGSVIANNVILRAVQRKNDGGAVYVSMHGGSTSHVTVRDNFIRDQGAPGVDLVGGIYLDDFANNVTVTNNVVGPPTPGDSGPHGRIGIIVHNGSYNVISGNIFDLGNESREFTVVWYRDRGNGMTGEAFIRNTVIASFTGNNNTSFAGLCSGFAYCQNSGSAGDYTIQNNTYHNYAGGEERTDGPIASDSWPIHQTPSLSGSTYRDPPSGGWGPPGLSIPQGTTPVSPR